MTTPYKLPSDFIPFEELIVCSNLFQNGIAVVGFENQPFLLIGKGYNSSINKSSNPQVWLSLPATLAGSNDEFVLVYAIQQNKSSNPLLTISETELSTTVKFNQTPILEVHKVNDKKAEITRMDLRPLGINLQGEKYGLSIGGIHYSNNSFIGIHTLFNVQRPK
jgi:hypothetical protein